MASGILVASYVILGLVISGLLAVVCAALLKLNKRLDDWASRLDPLLEKADTALSVTTETVENLGSRAEVVLERSEAAVEGVQDKVDRAAEAVTHVVNAPIIQTNSLLAGLSRGLSTFSRLQRKETKTKFNRNK